MTRRYQLFAIFGPGRSDSVGTGMLLVLRLSTPIQMEGFNPRKPRRAGSDGQYVPGLVIGRFQFVEAASFRSMKGTPIRFIIGSGESDALRSSIQVPLKLTAARPDADKAKRKRRAATE